MAKNDDRVTEWEEGLPSPDELTPLSQTLISPELASAFSIRSDSFRTAADVQRASQSAFTTLIRPAFKEAHHHSSRAPAFAVDGANNEDRHEDDSSLYSHPFQSQAAISSSPGKQVLNGSPYASSPAHDRRPDMGSSSIAFGSQADNNNAEGRKTPKPNDREAEEAESGTQPENSNDDQSARTLKRPRLVWTPQLHKRFVDAVAHLGIKHAVPKTIMQLMNVEGLTRENVASHLQKYRLYLKRMQGFSNEGPSTSDQLFASTPVPPSLAASTHFLAGHRDDVIAFPFPAAVAPLPIAGISHTPIPSHINSVGPFPGFDPRAYSALARTLPSLVTPGDHRNITVDNQHQSDSPPRPILTLFPSTD